jgi:hypothetical protein
MGRPATHPRRGPTEWATVVPTVRTGVYAYIQTGSYIRTHARTNVRTCIQTHVHAYIHASSYKRTYLRTYIHTSTPVTIRTTSISWACDEAPPPGRCTAHRLHSTRPPARLRRTSATSRASNGCARSSARRSTGSAQRLLTHVAHSAPSPRSQGTVFGLESSGAAE